MTVLRCPIRLPPNSPTFVADSSNCVECCDAFTPLSMYYRMCQAVGNFLLRSILLRVSSLVTGEDVLTNQVRDEDVFFVTETIRVSVYTAVLASVASRFHPKTAMLPVGAVHRRTRRTVGRLTGGRGVNMKDESHNCCASSSKNGCHVLTPRTCGFFDHILPIR